MNKLPSAQVRITLTESGFRPNWLSFQFPFTMFDKMGKKVEHHQPHQVRTLADSNKQGNNVMLRQFPFSLWCTKLQYDLTFVFTNG